MNMAGDITQARETIRRCRILRDSGRPEAVLRSELQSALRVIFPASEDRNWIDHYVEGAEARTTISKAGQLANRFIDNLVGYTTIEYEADLRNVFKREQGFRQVREHAAGLLREGVPESQVRGILSDTVEWHAYDVHLNPETRPESCGPDDISLVSVDDLDLRDDDGSSAPRLIAFIRKHLAREQSRQLRAEFITSDLGLASNLYTRASESISQLVEVGRATDASIELATSLWSRFVDHLEDVSDEFRLQSYVDELYVTILARLMTANVLAGRALLSDDETLESIIAGTHFVAAFQIDNLVEHDYFGWLSRATYLPKIVPAAREIQRDLYAYDFSTKFEEDLFGRLMAELATRSHRKLLGQEWTPSWLARDLAERCLSGIPEGELPHVVDMCCGSGTIIAEILKTVRERYPGSSLDELAGVATGFDIDPLAVTLSKATWVVTLSEEIKTARAPVVIPIYHADSLFAVTPVSAKLPLVEENASVAVTLDGRVVQLPNLLLQARFRELFDALVDWAYDEARHAKEGGSAGELSLADAETFISRTEERLRSPLPNELHQQVVETTFELAKRMSELALNDRNGIWAFILRNTYRPALLTGQFNGLVSNPPWLALSGLGNNPYRDLLTQRAELYGMRPTGQSFLHLELGTTHLIHAIDRYLKPEASVACLVPGSILNGTHHEPLRRAKYLSSKRPVPFELLEVWSVAHGTFKYPAAALIGRKVSSPSAVRGQDPVGYRAEPSGLAPTTFAIRRLGQRRSAWLVETGAELTGDPGAISPHTAQTGLPERAQAKNAIPQQGADLMPRTAVCVQIVDNGTDECRVETPGSGSPWAYTLKSAKELKSERFTGHVANRFIYRMAQSENLLPFVLGDVRAPVALPATRDDFGSWTIHDEASIRRLGYTRSARWFAAINEKLARIGKGKTIQQRIDERGKLSKQAFPSDGYLLVSGAGGKHIAAACLPLSEHRDLVIDQTLYWQIAADADEAWYTVGVLNSAALTAAITPFNPKGDFGERHVHTLPYRMMPRFDRSRQDHNEIAELAKEAAGVIRELLTNNPSLADPTKSLPARRKRLRDILQRTPAVQRLERSYAAILETEHGR